MKKILFVALGAVLGALGCGDSKPQALPAGGKVSIKGSKIVPEGALVVFHPKDPGFEKIMSGKPFAKVEKDGTFKLTSFQTGDGAPAAEYGVTIVWNAPNSGGKSSFSLSSEGAGASGPDQFGGRYGRPTQPLLSAKVEKGSPNQFNFELEIASGGEGE
jgi:hypothetical protein